VYSDIISGSFTMKYAATITSGGVAEKIFLTALRTFSGSSVA
jgi:hypothetical protein